MRSRQARLTRRQVYKQRIRRRLAQMKDLYPDAWVRKRCNTLKIKAHKLVRTRLLDNSLKRYDQQYDALQPQRFLTNYHPE